MPGSSTGEMFKVTTFGESHGPSIGCVVDGCPPGLALSEADIQPDLDRRKPGTSKYTSQRREADRVSILSGVFEGLTTGTPIGMLIENSDPRTKDYDQLKEVFRPGHADFTYQKKYGIRDHRGGGRASARETAMRVAAGAIAKKYLGDTLGISIRGYLSQMGDIQIETFDWQAVSQNPFFCPDPTKVKPMADLIDQLRRQGDSIGAKICVVAEAVPAGLGEPVFNKLDADLAAALMSINAVKAVEIGAGVAAAGQQGSEHRDELFPEGFGSNHAGGILGGISTGQDILARITLKPTSSILIPAASIDIQGNPREVVTTGRHDPCVGVRATPIAEAMLALVLMDHLLRHRGQNMEATQDEQQA